MADLNRRYCGALIILVSEGGICSPSQWWYSVKIVDPTTKEALYTCVARAKPANVDEAAAAACWKAIADRARCAARLATNAAGPIIRLFPVDARRAAVRAAERV